jgi:Fungal Zn(2)-Cys(6) binuclear cluster domain/Fungal specific transcription factor domain
MSSRSQPSLLACLACRSKHLKCDAQLPVCGRCTKTRQRCFYRESQRGLKRGARNDNSKSVERETAGAQPSSSSSPQTTSTQSAPTDGSFSDSANEVAAYLASPTPGDNSIDLGIYDFDFNNLATMMTITRPTDPQLLDGSPPPGHMIYDLDASGINLPLMTSDEMFAEHLPAIQYDNGLDNIVVESLDVFPNPKAWPPVSLNLAGAEPRAQPDYLIEAFYSFFHPAHPFNMPHLLYTRNPCSVSPCLKAAMQFTGGHFLPASCDIDALRHNALAIELPSAPDDGAKVQAMLLLAMTCFARSEHIDARALMGRAMDLALDLKMHHRDFSILAGYGNPTLEECWRRTWWELYTVSCLLTALSGSAAIWPLRDIQSDVPLPSEEESYKLCQPTRVWRTAQEMQVREFLAEESVFSSFAYKIEATRLLGKVLELGSEICCVRDSAVGTMDGELSNFLLSLPPEKREIIEVDGAVDEVLFNAHMIINWALIFLHRPRSWLSSGPQHYETACTLNAETQQQGSGETGASGPLSDTHAVHTSKAISAASQMLKAASVRTSWKRHTPCFTCAAASAAVVLLPAYALEQDAQRSQALQGRLQLAINSLARIGEVWALARLVKTQITQFAAKIFTAGRNPSRPAALSSMSAGPSARNELMV